MEQIEDVKSRSQQERNISAFWPVRPRHNLLGTRGNSSKKISSRFFDNRGNCPVKFLDSLNYYLLKLESCMKIWNYYPAYEVYL